MVWPHAEHSVAASVALAHTAKNTRSWFTDICAVLGWRRGFCKTNTFHPIPWKPNSNASVDGSYLDLPSVWSLDNRHQIFFWFWPFYVWSFNSRFNRNSISTFGFSKQKKMPIRMPGSITTISSHFAGSAFSIQLRLFFRCNAGA